MFFRQPSYLTIFSSIFRHKKIPANCRYYQIPVNMYV
nr:MAG TPA: hypothetical protein [Caudoviricetes sp.]